ncbi:MAG: hypothetical protein Q9219_000682 [cf. Caloplaca sp. 3 TL-2023]
MAQGAINIATDFYILLLPIPGVLQLQLPLKRKIGICAIFMTGSLACLASVMGLYYRTQIDRFSDVTWQLVDVLIWVVVELTVGVMCSCMPALAGFFHHYISLFRLVGSFFSSRVKSLGLFKLPGKSRSTSSDKSKRLATKDIKMTLGTQIDGDGRFLDPASVFAREEDWLKLSQAAYKPPSLARQSSGTRREWHEGVAELKRQSLSSHHPGTMARKPLMQTHICRLSVQDEERGSPALAVSGDETEGCPQSPRGRGYL